MQELYHYNIEDFYRFTLSESELILERRPARGEEKTATERIPLEDVTACAHTELHLNRDGTPYPLIALTIRSAGFFDQEEGEQQISPATPELVRDLDAHHVPISDREKLQRAAPDLKSPKQVFSRTDGAGEYILILSLLLRLVPLDCPASVYLVQQTEAIAHLDFHRALTLSAVTSWGTWLVFLALAVWVVKKSSGKPRPKRV